METEKVKVKGKKFSAEAMIIVGLMRKLKITSIKIDDLDINCNSGVGLTLGRDSIDLTEVKDVSEE